MAFIIGTIQFYYKSEPKQAKLIKIERDISKSDRTFPYLQSSKLFK